MFTGIVQGVGRVVSLAPGSLCVEPAPEVLNRPWNMGESVAINGCCLTVVGHENDLRFDISEETIRRTNLGLLKPGDSVNMERAMSADGAFGGHIVTGHVDATGELVSAVENPESWTYRFRVPIEFDRYLIDKGSIAVDGISLTVCDPVDGEFDVWIIPHTLKMTVLGGKKPGDKVNLEFDMIAKLIEKMLGPVYSRLRDL